MSNSIALMKRSLLVRCLFALAVVLLMAGSTFRVRAVADRRFDICTFCCPCSATQHMCQAQFDALNYVTANGHFVLMGSDAHRAELNTNGNFLGIYYNRLNDDFGTLSANAKADDIETNYVVPNFTTTGAVPAWIALNEISSAWATNSTYRAWVTNVAKRLKTNYGHSVITFTFYDNPGTANAAAWKDLANVSYIAVESYLSGAAINANGNSVSWCQTQYTNSLSTWLNNTGVPKSQLYYGEDFAQTLAGTNYGRANCSTAGWNNAMNARAAAAHNLKFSGYFSYAWDWNQMNVPDTNLIQFEGTYATNSLP